MFSLFTGYKVQSGSQQVFVETKEGGEGEGGREGGCQEIKQFACVTVAKDKSPDTHGEFPEQPLTKILNSIYCKPPSYYLGALPFITV